MSYEKAPLPSMDFDENEIRGTMPATDIAGTYISKNHVIDYTFSKDAKDNWDQGETSELIADVLGEYEDLKRGGYKPSDKSNKNSTFRLVPNELHYEATGENEILVMHTSGQESENLQPKLTGYSYVFVYRRRGKDRNLDVLKISDSNKLSTLETFDVSKGYKSKPNREWGIALRENRLRAIESSRRKEYIDNILKASRSLGYDIKMNTDKGFLWKS